MLKALLPSVLLFFFRYISVFTLGADEPACGLTSAQTHRSARVFGDASAPFGDLRSFKNDLKRFSLEGSVSLV